MTSTTFFIIFIPVLSILLLTINLLLAPHFPYQEKDSAFECGFHSFLGQNRTQFSISFFIFGLLFLLFDLEIILVYPYSVSGYSNDAYGLAIVLIFFSVLTIGFIFELGKNALSIDSKQTSLPDNENTQKLDVFIEVKPQITVLAIQSGISLFNLCRRNTVSSFNLGSLNVRDILYKYHKVFIMVVLIVVYIILSLYMELPIQCDSPDMWKDAYQGDGPTIDKASRANHNDYRNYITRHFESLRVFWDVNYRPISFNYGLLELPTDDHSQYGVTPSYPEVVRKLCECRASLVDATQSCKFCSPSVIDQIKQYGGDL